MHAYDLTAREDYSVVIARLDGSLHTATSEHPNWDAIREALESDAPEQEVAELFDATAVVNAKFESVSERVAVRNGIVYFDGDPVDNSLTRQVVRFHEEGADFRPLVNFFEKVQTNPNEHSREQLYTWLDNRDFTVNADGDIVAYKSVRLLEEEREEVDDDGSEGVVRPAVYGSIATQGKAVVNGEERSGSIRQSVGDEVTMPRSAVQHDPSVGCHTGLHVGTWGYASTFSGNTVLTVAVNPRDVVSVPTDCNAQKVRTCRYVVLEAVDNPLKTAYYGDEDEDDDLGFEGAVAGVWYEDVSGPDHYDF